MTTPSDPTTDTPDDERPRDAATDDTIVARPAEGLFRSATDRMLFGVCGGVAERYGLESLLVRLAFVATVFLGGAGVLFYLAAALLIPAAPVAAPPGGRPPSGPAVGAANGVLRVLVVIAAGIAVLFALGAAAVLSLVVTALFGAWPVAVLLLVVAALLVVSASRSRIATATLLLLALALAVPATAATIGGLRVDRSFGDRTRRPTSPALAAEGYRLGFGHLTVDLRGTAFRTGTRTTIPVRLGAGRLGVLLPDERCVAWTIRTRVNAGETRFFRFPSDGGGLGDSESVTEIDPPRGSKDDRPRVTLDLRARAGQIAVGLDQATISDPPTVDRGATDRGVVMQDDGSFRTRACRSQDRRTRR
jgi:phage shock protein PspC (stress-responsive transcriptional regulator)